MRYKDVIITSKKILEVYESGGIFAVRNFLNESNYVILPNTFAEKAKKYLDNHDYDLVEAELRNMTNKFKI